MTCSKYSFALSTVLRIPSFPACIYSLRESIECYRVSITSLVDKPYHVGPWIILSVLCVPPFSQPRSGRGRSIGAVKYVPETVCPVNSKPFPLILVAYSISLGQRLASGYWRHLKPYGDADPFCWYQIWSRLRGDSLCRTWSSRAKEYELTIPRPPGMISHEMAPSPRPTERRGFSTGVK